MNEYQVTWIRNYHKSGSVTILAENADAAKLKALEKIDDYVSEVSLNCDGDDDFAEVTNVVENVRDFQKEQEQYNQALSEWIDNNWRIK